MTGDVLPGTGRAGGSADAKFRQMARDWRRARLRRFSWVCLGLGTVLLLINGLLPTRWQYADGILVGALYATWLGVRDLALPSYIDRWRVGADGEKDTAKALQRLGPEWSVQHDQNGRYGNVDHQVIGAAGVFLLDTKAWHHGITEITPDGPVVTPDHDQEARWTWDGLPGRMRAAAAGCSKALGTLSGEPVRVTPVVVIWGEFPGKVQERRGVTYVAGEHLTTWLTGLPVRLTTTQRAALQRLIQ